MIQKPPFCRNTSNFAVGHSGQIDFIQSNLIFFLVWMSQSIPYSMVVFVQCDCQLPIALWLVLSKNTVQHPSKRAMPLSSTCYWEETVGHCNAYLFKFILIIIVRAEVFFLLLVVWKYCASILGGWRQTKGRREGTRNYTGIWWAIISG